MAAEDEGQFDQLLSSQVNLPEKSETCRSAVLRPLWLALHVSLERK